MEAVPWGCSSDPFLVITELQFLSSLLHEMRKLCSVSWSLTCICLLSFWSYCSWFGKCLKRKNSVKVWVHFSSSSSLWYLSPHCLGYFLMPLKWLSFKIIFLFSVVDLSGLVRSATLPLPKAEILMEVLVTVTEGFNINPLILLASIHWQSSICRAPC